MNDRMKPNDTLQISIGEIDSDMAIERLAAFFDSTAENGLIEIPSHYGTGFIKRIKIEKGLNLRVWNYTTIPSVIFQKIERQESQRSFHICYPLNTAALLVSNKTVPKFVHLPWGIDIVFFSSDAAVNMQTRNGKGLCAIDISFTHEWLAQAFNFENPATQSCFRKLNEVAEPITVMDSCTLAEQKMVSGIHAAVSFEKISNLFLRAEVYLLVADFFTRLPMLSIDQLAERRIHYDKELLSVKKILSENLEDVFPGIHVIAKEVALSESTLKRYFKVLFNQTVHEHYLQLKMEHAKQLLVEDDLQVNEVAGRLKYEKVSSFIDTFKRQYGYSPGQLKKINDTHLRVVRRNDDY